MTKKKQTIIRPEVLDELLQECSALPTQQDLFGPEGVIKQLSKALIERCLEAELSTHLGKERASAGRRGKAESPQWVLPENTQKRAGASRNRRATRSGGQL